MGREKPTSARRLTKRDHQARALELKAGGMSTPDIANTLGVHRGTVWTWIREGLAETVAAVHENAGTYRAIQAGQIEELIAAYLPAAVQGDYAAADRVLKAWARQATLLGLDLREPDPVSQHLHVNVSPVAGDASRDLMDQFRAWAQGVPAAQAELPDVIDHQGEEDTA